ncbi:MAG TPA: prolipoprotein diacylglyceryl transferase [Acidimicrobiales bacterium]
MFAAIPYTTFPDIDLGPLPLRTFGLMVAIGVLVGAWVAAVHIERFGISRDETYRTATWMVLAGIVGARLTWAATHTEEIDNPIDVIAIWEGGIQFTGGFIAALIVGVPFFRRWTRLQRWRSLDGYALGLTIGLAIGRIGCYAVGEHFGRTSDFFLATRYEGGEVREPFLGDVRLVEGTTFHNTALYEFLFLLVLFAGLVAAMAVGRRRGRELAPGTLIGAFVLYYGVARFLTDTLRVNDERVLSMTGAQWFMLVLIPAGLWIVLKVRPRLAALAAAEPEVEAPESEAEAPAADAEAPAAETPAAAEAATTEAAEPEPAASEATEAAGDEPATASESEAAEARTGDASGAAAESEAAEARADAEPAAAGEPAATDEPKPEEPAAEESTTGSRTGGPESP